jgi:molybdopterin-guanine dinucleotide biosynthesis protein A
MEPINRQKPAAAIVLATARAGRLYDLQLSGRAVLDRVLDAIRPLAPRQIIVVSLSEGAARLRGGVGRQDVTWVTTDNQGPVEAISAAAHHVLESGPVLIVPGHLPRLSSPTLEAVRAAGEDAWGSMAIVDHDDPGALTRVVSKRDGTLARLVEAADASINELALRMVDGGIYLLPISETLELIESVRPLVGASYFSDVVTAAARSRGDIQLVHVQSSELLSAAVPSGLLDLMRHFEREEEIRRLSSFLESDNEEPSPHLGEARLVFRQPHSAWDLFICHASEDKEVFVRPLAKRLVDHGFRVWFDEYTLSLGDSLRREIERGLAASRFGVVVLSRSFFAKDWPQIELDALTALEVERGKRILPIWHQISRSDILACSPRLADLFAVDSSRGLDEVVRQISGAIASAI